MHKDKVSKILDDCNLRVYKFDSRRLTTIEQIGKSMGNFYCFLLTKIQLPLVTIQWIHQFTFIQLISSDCFEHKALM